MDKNTAQVLTDAENYYGMALWYAWGRLDSGQYRDRKFATPLDAFDFASLVKARRIEWLDGEVTMFESIQGQWDKYVASLEVRDATRQKVLSLVEDLANTLSDPTQAWDIAVADFVHEVEKL